MWQLILHTVKWRGELCVLGRNQAMRILLATEQERSA